MIDFRKLLVTFVIAILFAILVRTSIDAIVAPPEYNTYCNETTMVAYPPDYYGRSNLSADEQKQIQLHDEQARACEAAFNAAQKRYEFTVFLVSAIAGLLATIIGMYVPVTTPVGMAVASGLILGGVFSLFVGTIGGWGGIQLVARPFIILGELLVVIFVAYKRLNERSQATVASANQKRK